MVNKLNWTLNLDRATVSFGRLLPFSGNTYTINLSGVRQGEIYVIYVMTDDGIDCLAKSVYKDEAYSLALNSKALWEEFGREPHEARPFHCFIRNATAATDEEGNVSIREDSTVAEGDLTIIWNPLWTDAQDGAAYTTRGERGPQGICGPMGPISQVKDPDTDKWYNVYARLNEDGERVLVMEQEDTDPRNGGAVALASELAETNKAIDELRANGVYDSSGLFDIEIDGSLLVATAKATEMRGNALSAVSLPNINKYESLSVLDGAVVFKDGKERADRNGWMAIYRSPQDGTLDSSVCVDVGTYDEDGEFVAAYTRVCENGSAVFLGESVESVAYIAFLPIPKGASVRLRENETMSKSNIRFFPCQAELG